MLDNKQDALEIAWQVLEDAVMTYKGEPVGIIASNDPKAPAENYAECFVRDFIPCAFVYLLEGKFDIVKNFLEIILKLRGQQEELAGHQMLPGVMPASFKVVINDAGEEELHADFGNRAIGRVAPVDSMMWWILLLQAYTLTSGDKSLAQSDECQRGIRTILTLLLRDRFEVFPTLLVPDGAFMIDRRMGVFGHPLEIQSLFYGVLEASEHLLLDSKENNELLHTAKDRQMIMMNYVRLYYWLDQQRLNEIHRYETEIFGEFDNANVLNIYPESIPDWLVDWLPEEAGYMVGNLGPGRMDFRFFAQGNLLAALLGLATEQQARQMMELYDQRWNDLLGRMPAKICYPAMEGVEWRLMTGSDPKNTPWSYHNGGNWPVLLWPFVAAALQSGRRDLAQKAIDIAYHRLPEDHWPEYYDGRHGRLIGRRSNFHQTWSAAALILSQKMLENPRVLVDLGICNTELADPYC